MKERERDREIRNTFFLFFWLPNGNRRSPSILANGHLVTVQRAAGETTTTTTTATTATAAKRRSEKNVKPDKNKTFFFSFVSK